MRDSSKPPPEVERSHFAAGQVQRVILFAIAIAKLHPEPAAMLAEFEQGKPIPVGILEQKRVPEA